jgi:hypothetical protein
MGQRLMNKQAGPWWKNLCDSVAVPVQYDQLVAALQYVLPRRLNLVVALGAELPVAAVLILPCWDSRRR